MGEAFKALTNSKFACISASPKRVGRARSSDRSKRPEKKKCGGVISSVLRMFQRMGMMVTIITHLPLFTHLSLLLLASLLTQAKYLYINDNAIKPILLFSKAAFLPLNCEELFEIGSAAEQRQSTVTNELCHLPLSSLPIIQKFSGGGGMTHSVWKVSIVYMTWQQVFMILHRKRQKKTTKHKHNTYICE